MLGWLGTLFRIWVSCRSGPQLRAAEKSPAIGWFVEICTAAAPGLNDSKKVSPLPHLENALANEKLKLFITLNATKGYEVDAVGTGIA